MQVAVVTGGATGIGAALARRLAGRGWHCVLVGRREERLRAAAEEVGGEYEVCDVAEREAVDRMAASVRERHPEVGLLVNNAGVAGRGNYLDLTPERIEDLIRINYLGSVWCLLAFLPALEALAYLGLANFAPAVENARKHDPPEPLLRGDELGLSPGPEIGRLLELIAEERAAGTVSTREEALELVRRSSG